MIKTDPTYLTGLLWGPNECNRKLTVWLEGGKINIMIVVLSNHIKIYLIKRHCPCLCCVNRAGIHSLNSRSFRSGREEISLHGSMQMAGFYRLLSWPCSCLSDLSNLPNLPGFQLQSDRTNPPSQNFPVPNSLLLRAFSEAWGQVLSQVEPCIVNNC